MGLHKILPAVSFDIRHGNRIEAFQIEQRCFINKIGVLKRAGLLRFSSYGTEVNYLQKRTQIFVENYKNNKLLTL